MPGEVVLIQCGSAKAVTAKPARDLYVGGLFKASASFAESRGCLWGILSARHGLLLPDQVVTPYDLRVEEMSEMEREVWAAGVRKQLFKMWPGSRFLALVSERYLIALRGLWIRCPLVGMRIGKRMAWLKRSVKAMVTE